MAVTFTNLWERVLSRCNGLPANVAYQRLYEAAREFLSRSEAWTHDETQNVVAGQTTYTLAMPTGITADVKRVKTVWYGTDSADKLDDYVVDVSKYEFAYANTVVFYDAYTEALTNGLTTRIVLVPNLANHQVSNEVMDRWGLRGVMALALATVREQPGKAWTDAGDAAMWRQRYLTAVAEAKAETYRRGKAGDIRVVPRAYV